MSRLIPPGAPSERGFTILELMVATVVLILVLLLANGLLVESLRIFAAGGRDLRRPDRVLALRLLRDDLLASAPISVGPFWRSDPLDVRLADGFVRWERIDDRLERRGIALDGTDLGGRVVLDDVLLFRWRTWTPGLVEVEIARRTSDDLPTAALRASTSVWARSGHGIESAVVVAGSRRTGW